MKEHVRILIVGGGYAGIYAARMLAACGERHGVTLVDKNAYTTVFPSLPDIAGGRLAPRMAHAPLVSVLPAPVTIRNDTIRSLDLTNRTVHGERYTFEYERLIIACGSQTNFHGFSAPPSTHTLDSLNAARTLRDDFRRYLERQGDKAHVVVSGASYTGIELACCLRWMAERRGAQPAITMVDPAPSYLGFLSPGQHRHAEKVVESKQIQIHNNTLIEEATQARVSFSNGMAVDEPFLCWAAGARMTVGDIDGDVERANDGRLIVNSCLQVPGHPEVFVAGDAAAVSSGDGYLRRAVNFSIGGGACAGANCARQSQQMPLQRFRPLDLGWVVPLATTSVGVVFGKFPVPPPLGLHLHYLMSSYRGYTVEQRVRYAVAAVKTP
ncbi:MAG: hypothetical protein GF331_15380 [Chitinivibrionales bacterium]|nr:hypothetical protein [Chitinivibrionales bacterium]